MTSQTKKLLFLLGHLASWKMFSNFDILNTKKMPHNMFSQLNIFPHPLKQFQQLCICKELVDFAPFVNMESISKVAKAQLFTLGKHYIKTKTYVTCLDLASVKPQPSSDKV